MQELKKTPVPCWRNIAAISIAEFMILKSSFLTCWQQRLKCCIVVREMVRINTVTNTAIHNRQLKGNRNTCHFRSCRFGFLIMIHVLKLGKNKLKGAINKKLSYVFCLMSERKALNFSKNCAKI